MNNIDKFLLAAASELTKEKIDSGNPYRDIGFDAGQPRLGWVMPQDTGEIKKFFELISPVLKDKEVFIFIGMGGSVNGIKPLLEFFKKKDMFTLDSLDPKALDLILSKIKNPEKTLVVAISKSGTTKETQLLAKTLKDYLVGLNLSAWENNFLWLTDPNSFLKLDQLGWTQVAKAAIQPNLGADIGGRFSSPSTNVFLLPLYLILDRKIEDLISLYSSFAANLTEIRKKALTAAFETKINENFYFSPIFSQKWAQSFTSWVVQLFQESLGGKSAKVAVKTVPNLDDLRFRKLDPDFSYDCGVLLLMSYMYYFQIFVAYLAALLKINFVDQKFVEMYKKQMQALEKKSLLTSDFLEGDIDFLVQEVSKKIKQKQIFIEVITYFHSDLEVISKLKQRLSQAFKEKIILFFAGSDWNHQSYQAAFDDKNTFYLLLCLSNYSGSKHIPLARTLENTETLKRIALATYQTISDKSILFNLQAG